MQQHAVATPSRRQALIEFLRVVGTGDACILWPWAHRPSSYVRVSLRGHIRYAHRWVWEQVNGPIPDGFEVCHNCPNGDNPSCIRPSHLWLGTHSENIRDAYAKGRMHGNLGFHVRGEDHHSARFTAEDIYRIRRLVAAGTTQNQLAREYGVTRTAINHIVKRRSWAHVDDEQVPALTAQA